MPDSVYAKGRIMESLSFITQEMDEFESEYSSKTVAIQEPGARIQEPE